MRVTVIFVVVAVPGEILLGLLLAFLFNRSSAARGCPALDPDPADLRDAARRRLSVLHDLLRGRAGRSAFTGIPWLSDPHWALVSVILVDIWQWTPFCFLVFLAALQGIPDELVESGAARHQLALADLWLAGDRCRCCSR